MGITRRLGALIFLTMAACSPVAAGPELPRPPQVVTLAPTTTTPPLATTTSLDPATEMAAECPSVVCLVYRIAPEARWSDGAPVVAADFVATVASHQDPLASDFSPGYDRIVAVDVIDDKTVRVGLSEKYGPWESLFARLVPAHAETLDLTMLPSTGPFLLDEWTSGDRIVVLRNDDWWSDVDPISGDPLGSMTRIEFVFIPDPDDRVDALLAGDVDLIAARPDQEMVEDLAEADGVEYVLAPGPFWEHIDFQHDDEMLTKPWVREVFELAIDRQKVIDRTMRLIDQDTQALDNTIWMSNTVEYEPHFEDRFDPVAAEQLLVDHGCVRDGSVYVCGEREMSFVWASTSDDRDRREILDSVSEDLATIGIELVPDLRVPSDFVTREFLFGGPDVWQLVNFSWKAGSDPARGDQTFYCDDSDLNVNRFCSREVDDMVRAASQEMDPAARAILYNDADRHYLAERALIPLYQKPVLLAWASGLDGPNPNYTTSSDLWNVSSWTGAESLVVALSAEPSGVDILSTADENANIVLSTLLYGAFGMDPALRHVPVLVESVTVVPGR